MFKQESEKTRIKTSHGHLCHPRETHSVIDLTHIKSTFIVLQTEVYLIILLQIQHFFLKYIKFSSLQQ